MLYVRCATECKTICVHVKYKFSNLIMTHVAVIIQCMPRF
jgi:hypothetical protein